MPSGTTGGASGGASRGNAMTRTSTRVTTPSGPHSVTHATHANRWPLAPRPTGLTQENSKSAGNRMPGGALSTVRTNPHVVTALYRQNAVQPVRVYGQRGGAYRSTPAVR